MMETDWIDEVREDRDRGINRPLLQSQHKEVNARYPGLTLEYCCDCGCPTGRAGKGEDSLFTDDDEGPFCWECWEEILKAERDALDAHPRAAKLISSGKFFLVVAIDEPYFVDVYELIRENENRKGTWTDEDEDRFLGATRKEIEKG